MQVTTQRPVLARRLTQKGIDSRNEAVVFVCYENKEGFERIMRYVVEQRRVLDGCAELADRFSDRWVQVQFREWWYEAAPAAFSAHEK